MNIEGIWTIEIYGLYGWERKGILVLEDGRIVGGGNAHYTMGSYELTGQQFNARMKLHYYVATPVLFGEAADEITLILEGMLKKEVISGSIGRPDKPEQELPVRMLKRMDLTLT